MSPVTGMAGTNFTVFSYWKFQPGRPGWNARNSTKMVEHKLVLFTAIVAFWTLATLLIMLIRLPLKWKYIQKNSNPYTTVSMDPSSTALILLGQTCSTSKTNIGKISSFSFPKPKRNTTGFTDSPFVMKQLCTFTLFQTCLRKVEWLRGTTGRF